MFWVKKATAAAFALSAVFALGIGAGLSTRTGSSGAVAQDREKQSGSTDAPRVRAENNDAAQDQVAGTRAQALKKIENDIYFAEAAIAALEAQTSVVAIKIDQLSTQLRKLTDSKEQEQAKLSIASLRREAERRAPLIKAKKDRVVILRAVEKSQSAALTDREKAITDTEEQIGKLEQMQVSTRTCVQVTQLRLEFTKKVAKEGSEELLDEQSILQKWRSELESVTAQLDDTRGWLTQLKMPAVKVSTCYLELTVVGKVNATEFVMQESSAADPNERGTRPMSGPVTTRDPVMLATLLRRAKADPTGPQQVRVIVQPDETRGVGASAALKACDSAGYKTVTFTGYVFEGGFATPLDPDQKGEVAGYKRYDAAEVKPADLLKEIADGLSKF